MVLIDAALSCDADGCRGEQGYKMRRRDQGKQTFKVGRLRCPGSESSHAASEILEVTSSRLGDPANDSQRDSLLDFGKLEYSIHRYRGSSP
jgi:hypothetical protein